MLTNYIKAAMRRTRSEANYPFSNWNFSYIINSNI